MSSFSGLLNNAALMLILCVIYDTFGVHAIARKTPRDCFTGILVGLTGIIVMLDPWHIQPGVFFDTRWVLLSLCGLFFGFIPTAIAVIITGSFRLYQGGAGGMVGTVVIVVTACVGVLWRYGKEKYYYRPLGWKELYLFGVLVQLAMLSCMFLMPAQMHIPIFKAVAPPVLAIYPVLTMIVGLILKRQEDRRTAEHELAAERERLAVTLRSIGDGVITTDVAGNVVMLNTVAEKLTGWTQEEARGLPLTEIFHIINEVTRAVSENPVTKVITSGRIVGLANHTALISKDGTERSIADSGAPITDAENAIIGVVLVFRDVTRQIKTEKELLKIKKLESIGILAGGIAHDFNNILTAILGNINLALFSPNLNEDTRRILSEAEKASIRAKNLARQLLTFAKGGDPVKEISSLETVIKDSADFVLHGDKVACRYDIPENLWPVDIDKGQVGQVIQNIVLNASHAMSEGGTITISCKNISSIEESESCNNSPHHFLLPPGRFAEICIQDKGVGIPANAVDKIFDPYFTTKKEGSGLGLTITHSIISNHGGYISVESSPGVGTTFAIYLPASPRTKEHKDESEAISTPAAKAKILVMDDEEMVRTVARSMLIRLGHEVEVAEHGEEAIRLYQDAAALDTKFDLVIMDLTIQGGMGGKDAVQAILNLNPDAKVIVSSGYSGDPIMAKFEDFGFCAAIAKPYRLQELEKAIRRITG